MYIILYMAVSVPPDTWACFSRTAGPKSIEHLNVSPLMESLSYKIQSGDVDNDKT